MSGRRRAPVQEPVQVEGGGTRSPAEELAYRLHQATSIEARWEALRARSSPAELREGSKILEQEGAAELVALIYDRLAELRRAEEATAGPIVLRREERALMVPISPGELIEIRQQASALGAAWLRAERLEAGRAAEAKATLKEARSLWEAANRQAASGERLADVDVEERLEGEVVVVIRLDTGAEVARRAATDEEIAEARQGRLWGRA